MTTSTLTFVGHATIHIEMDGVRLLTDPLLKRFVGPLQRLAPMPDPEIWQVDAVLISHLHNDHLDLASLKKIDRDTLLIVPKGAGPYLRMRRFSNVKEVERDEVVEIGGVKITATRADHGGRQFPWIPHADPLGYVIEGGCEIYFAGDTDLFTDMSTIGIDLDLALLPVWGWGPNLGEGHMNPERAAHALTHLRPEVAVPIHWGSYCPVGLNLLRPSFLTQPPRDFAEHAAELTPDVSVHILEPGQTLQLIECDKKAVITDLKS
jgi:L-ascorbate metabolism protein UlaG (beta-lactamase superfamily)